MRKPSNAIINEETASILFGFNPPVITAPSVLVAEFSTGRAMADAEALGAFPNPATDRLVVLAPEPLGAALRDAAGRVVRAWRLPGDRQLVKLDGLAPGAYALQATGPSGRPSAHPFIKQ